MVLFLWYYRDHAANLPVHLAPTIGKGTFRLKPHAGMTGILTIILLVLFSLF